MSWGGYTNCSKCGKDIQSANFKRHFEACERRQLMFADREAKRINGRVVCPQCGEYILLRSYGGHKSYCGKPNGQRDRLPQEARKLANAALLNSKSDRKKSAATRLLRMRLAGITRRHTVESRKKMSATRKAKFASGELVPARGVGYGKSGWYNDVWCDSSWELAWVLYHLDHGIGFVRNRDRFYYTDTRGDHTYTPDFKLHDGTYVEIKGWVTDNTRIKMSATKDIPILWLLPQHPHMQAILSYAREHYGNDFVRLYSQPAPVR